MPQGRLALFFLAISIIIIAVDFLLPSTLGGSELLGDLVEWGLLALSLFFLILFVAVRKPSF